jgi:lauroyl/myristoyl acyltransferase
MINLGCGAKGFPLTSVAMPVKNSFADRELNRLREKTGSRISPRSGAIRNVIKTLRDGRSTFLVLDQNTLPNEGGIFVPFFGLSAPVSKVTDALWSRTKATILVAWCVPDEAGFYTVYAKEPLVPDYSGSETITARLTLDLESVIREHPGFWLWSYKRWRFYCEGDDPSQFPFYAEPYEAYVEQIWR